MKWTRYYYVFYGSEWVSVCDLLPTISVHDEAPWSLKIELDPALEESDTSTGLLDRREMEEISCVWVWCWHFKRCRRSCLVPWNGGGGQDQSRHPGWHRHHGPQPVPGASGQYTTLQRSRHQEQQQQMYLSTAQCGNFKNFLSLRFYVKSKLANLEPQNWFHVKSECNDRKIPQFPHRAVVANFRNGLHWIFLREIKFPLLRVFAGFLGLDAMSS